MSSLAITKGADVFKAAVAVAPVTSWRFYDNIYTERYMRTPQENAKGYDENSPLNFTNRIKGKYLLIHVVYVYFPAYAGLPNCDLYDPCVLDEYEAVYEGKETEPDLEPLIEFRMIGSPQQSA